MISKIYKYITEEMKYWFNELIERIIYTEEERMTLLSKWMDEWYFEKERKNPEFRKVRKKLMTELNRKD